MGSKVTIGALAAVALLAALYITLRPREPWRIPPAAPGRFELVARVPRGAMAGDAKHGEALYRLQCATCHGIKGDGFGPAANFVWPLPRDHTDAAYMNSRTDEQLFQAVHSGGPAVRRSRLMPPWSDVFDETEIWSLVAYMRTLHPSVREIFPGFDNFKLREVVLDGDKIRAVEQALGSKLYLEDYTLAFQVAVGPDGQPAAYALFPKVTVDGRTIQLALGVNTNLRVYDVKSLRQIRVRERAPDAVDAFLAQFKGADGKPEAAPIPGFEDLCDALANAVHKALLLLREALRQWDEDVLEAQQVRKTFEEKPDTLPRGQRIYIKSCATCHGTTGNLVDAPDRDFRPRNHRDGAYMNRLSDAYVRSIIKYGGLHWNVSDAMPSYDQLSAEELDDLVKYIRSLARPAWKQNCPCDVMKGVCMMAEGTGKCCCADGHDPTKLCPNMRK